MTSASLRRALRGFALPLRVAYARLTGPRMAQVGARPQWLFRQAIHNGGHVRRLSDLRGRPLLIRFIGFG